MAATHLLHRTSLSFSRAIYITTLIASNVTISSVVRAQVNVAGPTQITQHFVHIQGLASALRAQTVSHPCEQRIKNFSAI